MKQQKEQSACSLSRGFTALLNGNVLILRKQTQHFKAPPSSDGTLFLHEQKSAPWALKTLGQQNIQTLIEKSK